MRSRATCYTTKSRTEPYLTFQAFTISCVACNLLHEQTTHGILFNLSGIHDFMRSVQLVALIIHVRIVIHLIYRNSKMFTHKKSAPKGALILNSLTIIYRSVHLISLCVYLLPPLR